jgi:phosphotransferase family enzyme
MSAATKRPGTVPPARWAELVLVSPVGALLGKLPPVLAGSPWWPEVASVIEAVRRRYGLEVTILRLLSSERDRPSGGRVTYLAEVADLAAPADLGPCAVVLDEQPLRNAYAKVGGPAADLAWASGRLLEGGLAPAGPPVQIKTWNLSSLWRIPIADGNVWLKAVPRFFGHEGALIQAMAPEPGVPRILAFEAGRLLMAEVPGQDLFEASMEQRLSMIESLVRLQRSWVGRIDQLLALGLPDRRANELASAIEQAYERTGPQLDAADRRVLTEFVAGLPRRFADLQACGLPDTLVHGDFHPGNVRGGSGQLTLLDWSDASVGQPLLDCSAFLERAPERWQSRLREHWQGVWRAASPGSHPERAWQLLQPIAAARQAVIYLEFLDAIEPAEHPYHRHDPAEWLRRVVRLLRDESAAAN